MDKETLFKRRAADTLDTVDLEDFVVTVRGLTHDEVEMAQKFDDSAKRDRLLVVMGMVDPVLTPADVEEWFKIAPAGDLVRVLEKLAQLSGLDEGAGKSRVPTPGE